MIIMRARRFWKKVISLKYIVALLIIICIAVVGIVYFTVDLDAYQIPIDNMEFDTEGFEDYSLKTEEELNEAYVVGENEKFIMFIDEKTTIITVCEKTSLQFGLDPAKPASYKVKYSSASRNTLDSELSNLEVSYASSDISKPEIGYLNGFEKSVNFKNPLTGVSERHYEIKYLTVEEDGYDGVQIYYTIGEFGSLKVYFPENFYVTVYKPARFQYDTDAAYNAAVKKYEEGYLATVGRLDNTFEERFRGNVYPQLSWRRNDDAGVYETYFPGTIDVYSQEARDYLLNVVFPEYSEYYDVPSFDEYEIEEELNQKYHRSNNPNGYMTDNYNNAYWRFSVEEDLAKELFTIGSEGYKRWFNNSESPLTNNPFMIGTLYDTYFKPSFRVIAADGRDIPYSYYQLGSIQGAALQLYEILYGTETTTGPNGNPVVYENVDGEFEEFVSSGFVARDEDGNFVYDENGNVTKMLYSPEIVKEDNSKFNVSPARLPAFKIAMEFKLTDEGMDVTIPRESLVDSSNATAKLGKEYEDLARFKTPFYITDVKICPNITNVSSKEEGYIIVPDGSGAIIEFNNGKTGAVNATYYGKDLAYPAKYNSEDYANLLLGMYGFVYTTEGKEGGLLTVLEKGGGQISLTAGVNSTTKMNYAYLSGQLRCRESVKTGTVSDSQSFDKYDKVLSPSDLAIKYIVLNENETSYTSVAKRYQQYLIERDGLTFKDNTDTLVNDIAFLGTFEKYSLFLGIKYMTADTLTTFEQAEAIINELSEYNVNNLNVSYKSWTSEYLEYEIGGKLKVAKVLGKTASMRSFYKFCVEKGIPFYPELSIATAKGYDYLLGTTRFNSRGVSNDESIHYQFDLATGRQDKKLSETYVLSPIYYKDVTQKLLNDFNKLKVWNEVSNGGFYLTDIGNMWAGDYRNGRQVYGAESVLYQQMTLEMISEKGLVKIAAPCDYAFKYVDMAVEVPVNSQMYTVYDLTIPFYQLVANGLFDYTTEQINGSTSRNSEWFFAKALESGSNFSYIISAEDPAILLETDYTQYFQAYYKNWKDEIINFTNEIDELGISACYLTNHEIIDGVSKVVYTNKTDSSKQITLVVNTSEKTKTYNGQTIPAYGYIKEQ